jgi:hypothetical protein
MVLPSVVMVPTRAEVVTAEEVLPDDCWAPEDPEPVVPRIPRAD